MIILDLFLRQSVQLVNQAVNLPICGLDLALEMVALVIAFGGGELLVQVEHGLYQGDHAVVASLSVLKGSARQS